MAHYLVRARPKRNRLADLEKLLAQKAFVNLRPFGRALTAGLRGARVSADGLALWEEEDYCSPPLAMERVAVLHVYFETSRSRQSSWAMGGGALGRCPDSSPVCQIDSPRLFRLQTRNSWCDTRYRRSMLPVAGS